MKLQAAFAIVFELVFAIRTAFLPTLLAIWKSPSLLLHPQQLSRLLFSNIWVFFGPVTDENGKPFKEALITPNAYGVVLDIGAGFGHTMKYLDRTKITKYVALEPNTNMHERIRHTGAKEGYTEADGTLVILSYGIEDTSSIRSALYGQQVDTIISILVLCSVPNPQRSITNLVRDTLKPGGAFLYYEHVLSPRKDVAWWQRFWAPFWSFIFDGCRLDRPSHLYVDQVKDRDGESIWKERELRGVDGESEEASHLFEHRIGRYIKA
ncbi:hypothetical protein AGABI2DRAFT_212927 [Agaricus bisporus var. bisporus H97]|uniref:hypothetical protein n=1 Tax=Agaricus bisporus var. bisporus (strain H97 / ATCC MYA-4626 / FGSC 10389) TaxID=936046 RepID=UPI00029F60C1|nr:hypothetical protein AGABI2DRAFT_212927 [Agaricus bisporus var. bisporus H97]EKV41880.1 hypothetical protein AGABI2DRAFT_212927 [Agaricus bisporus var. bisporus H97]